ncbi:MAG: glycosyltransferase family 39 protein [Gammaproteobacteria bacterium]
MRKCLIELMESRTGRACTIVLLIYGFLLGYLVWYSFYDYAQQSYPISWQAAWIAYPHGDVSKSYYRKKIFLSQNVRHAWIKVMAPDRFKIYVNGSQVGSAARTSVNVTSFFDITADLQPGTNVIAVEVSRATYPGNSMVAVEGFFENWQGIGHNIRSDNSWKVNRIGEWPLSGEPQWYEAAFIDGHWTQAKEVGVPTVGDNSRVSYDPTIYTERVRGVWIRSPSLVSEDLYLRYRFDLQTRPVDAWLRMAARKDQDYHLTVNEVPFGEKRASVGPVADYGSSKLTFDMYNIIPLLRAGPNVITIRVTGWSSKLEVLVDGFIRDAKGITSRISTPEGWKASTVETPRWASLRFDDAYWESVRSSGPVLAEDRLSKRIVEPLLPDEYHVIISIKKVFCILATILSILPLWAFSAIIVSRVRRVSVAQGLSLSSSAYGLMLLLLLGVLLVSYDVRFDQALPFQENVISIAIVLPLLLVVPLLFNKPAPLRLTTFRRVLRSRYAEIIVAVLIVSGLYQRLQDIDVQPLNGDEVVNAMFTQSVLENGYPTLQLTPSLPEKILTSSETVPYFMAIPSVIFKGMPVEFQIKFAGAIFGTLTILMLYIYGSWWFDKRVGLLAAALYSVLPMAILTAQYARYPSQLQFFALLAVHFCCRYLAADSHDKDKRKYIYLFLVAYSMTYFSWEGSVFLLPALVLGIMLYKGRDLAWLKDGHVWLCGIIVFVLIFLQISFRYIQGKGASVLGAGISEIQVAPQWVQPGYDAAAFLTNFLLVEKTQIISVLCLLGLVVCLKDKRLLFINSVLFTGLLLWTNLMETQDYRHLYYYLPLLLLSGCRIFFKVSDFLFREPSGLFHRSYATSLSALTRFGFVGFLLLSTNDYFLKLYNLPGAGSDTSLTRLDSRNDSGIKKAMASIQSEIEPGDKFIATRPHQLLFYSGIWSYFAETKLKLPVIFPIDGSIPVGRLVGLPWIYSTSNLNDVLNKNHRVWLILEAPMIYYDDEFLDYIRRHTLLKHDDYRTSVYLWKG